MIAKLDEKLLSEDSSSGRKRSMSDSLKVSTGTDKLNQLEIPTPQFK